MKEKENMKEIKKLKKDFRGMKERFKRTNPVPFKVAAELFINELCIAYEINDVDLNYVAITSYREVIEVLEERLSDPREKNIEMFKHFKMILEAFMTKFHLQAGRLYD